MRTRVTELLGVDYPIVQAPMGWIARAQLASAVSNAGGLGIIETSSGELDAVRDEIRKMRDAHRQAVRREHRPALRARSRHRRLRRRSGRQVRHHLGRRSHASTPPSSKDAGLTVFHVVPDARGGAQGGGRRASTGSSSRAARAAASRTRATWRRWCCCRWSCSKVDVPVIAAGGICDGRTMAAAFALGAEGVQMGTRMVSAAESPVHDNWKQAIVGAAETDTVFLNRFSPPGSARAAHRAQRAPRARGPRRHGRSSATAMDLYFGGDMEASLALGGQVVGRIDEVKPVAQIIAETMAEFRDVAGAFAAYA